jgi:hypothetical protein
MKIISSSSSAKENQVFISALKKIVRADTASSPAFRGFTGKLFNSGELADKNM